MRCLPFLYHNHCIDDNLMANCAPNGLLPFPSSECKRNKNHAEWSAMQLINFRGIVDSAWDKFAIIGAPRSCQPRSLVFFDALISARWVYMRLMMQWHLCSVIAVHNAETIKLLLRSIRMRHTEDNRMNESCLFIKGFVIFFLSSLFWCWLISLADDHQIAMLKLYA